jgi:translation initiation factor 1
MARNTRKGPPESTPTARAGFNSPFASLASLREALPSKTPQLREKDGAEVTRVEELGLAPEALEAWAQALQRGLACRASVEGDALVLDGDQRRAVPDLLLRRGVKRVSQA